MAVPLDATEWHAHRTLGATEWHKSRHMRRCQEMPCHSTLPSGMVVGFAHLRYWNVRAPSLSGKLSTKLPSSCLAQLPDAASELPTKA